MQTEFWVWMFIFFGFLMALLIILVLIWYLPLRKWAENFGYRTVLGFSGHPLAPWLDPHTDSLRILSLRRSWRSDRAGGLKGGGGRTCQCGSRRKADICSRSLRPGLPASEDKMAANTSDLDSDRQPASCLFKPWLASRLRAFAVSGEA